MTGPSLPSWCGLIPGYCGWYGGWRRNGISALLYFIKREVISQRCVTPVMLWNADEMSCTQGTPFSVCSCPDPNLKYLPIPFITAAGSFALESVGQLTERLLVRIPGQTRWKGHLTLICSSKSLNDSNVKSQMSTKVVRKIGNRPGYCFGQVLVWNLFAVSY